MRAVTHVRGGEGRRMQGAGRQAQAHAGCTTYAGVHSQCVMASDRGLQPLAFACPLLQACGSVTLVRRLERCALFCGMVNQKVGRGAIVSSGIVPEPCGKCADGAVPAVGKPKLSTNRPQDCLQDNAARACAWPCKQFHPTTGAGAAGLCVNVQGPLGHCDATVLAARGRRLRSRRH